MTGDVTLEWRLGRKVRGYIPIIAANQESLFPDTECPRCGRHVNDISAAEFSLYADVRICDSCGREERVMERRGVRPKPFEDWAVADYFEKAERVREIDVSNGVAHCRNCGCTDNCCCYTNGKACHWVEDDLCSACAGVDE